MIVLTWVEELWLDLAFFAFGESTAALGADWDGSVKDEAGDPPTSPVLGPPRHCPPPEKGMNVDVHVAEKEEVEGVFSPDGSAFSPSSFPLTTERELCLTSRWDIETSSCWSGRGSVLAAEIQGGNCFSNWSWEHGLWTGTSAVDAGIDRRASGWDGVSLAGGVAAVLMTSLLSSVFWVLLLSKYLKIDINCFQTILLFKACIDTRLLPYNGTSSCETQRLQCGLLERFYTAYLKYKCRHRCNCHLFFKRGVKGIQHTSFLI